MYHTTVHGIEARLTVVELCITQWCGAWNRGEVDCRRTVYHTMHGNIDEVEARLTVVELCITQGCME